MAPETLDTAQPELVENQAESRPRPRRWRSDEEVLGMVVRGIRTLGGRLAQSDPHSHALLRTITKELRAAEAQAVQGWRDSGWTDREIGEHLGEDGVTQQAVQQRWPRPENS